jgi:hypothetical protein
MLSQDMREYLAYLESCKPKPKPIESKKHKLIKSKESELIESKKKKVIERKKPKLIEQKKRKVIKQISCERLREVLNYDENRDVWTWLKPSSNRVKIGEVAGCLENGQWRIGIDGTRYSASRLAHLYLNGSFPTGYLRRTNDTGNM